MNGVDTQWNVSAPSREKSEAGVTTVFAVADLNGYHSCALGRDGTPRIFEEM